MAESTNSNKRAVVLSKKAAETLALSAAKKPIAQLKVVKETKNKVLPKASLTRKAKLLQSLIAFVATCAIYESGFQIDKARQHAMVYETYRAQLAKFLNKESEYAKMEEYRKNEFSEGVMMLAKGTRTLTGADIWNKGETVRKNATLWVAKNRSILLKIFTKTKQFDQNEGIENDERDDNDNDDQEKETELELTIPSGGSASEVTNALFVSLYNAEMNEKSKAKPIVIEDEDGVKMDKGEAKDDEDEGNEDNGEETGEGVSESANTTAKENSVFYDVEDIEEIPHNYLGDVAFYALKYWVLLNDDKKSRNNFLVSKLSDLMPTANSGTEPLMTGKSRAQLKSEKNELTQLNKRAFVDDKEEDEKDRREMQQAMVKRQLSSSEVSTLLQIANLLPENDPQRNEIITNALKQTTDGKAEYEAVEASIKERKRLRESRKANQCSEVKRIKKELYKPSTTPTSTIPPTKLSFSSTSNKH